MTIKSSSSNETFLTPAYENNRLVLTAFFHVLKNETKFSEKSLLKRQLVISIVFKISIVNQIFKKNYALKLPTNSKNVHSTFIKTHLHSSILDCLVYRPFELTFFRNVSSN